MEVYKGRGEVSGHAQTCSIIALITEEGGGGVSILSHTQRHYSESDIVLSIPFGYFKK